MQTIVSLTSDHCIGVKMGTEMRALRKEVAVQSELREKSPRRVSETLNHSEADIP